MLFTRVASFFLAFLTFGLVSYANPVVVERAVSPNTVASDLQTKVNSITSQLKGITTNTPANTAKAQSLVNELVSAFSEANAQASSGSLLPLEKRETAAAIAAVLAGVVETVGTVLSPVIILIPALEPLIFSLDIALNNLIVSLDFVVFGLVGALNGLLFGVAGILRGLGLTLFLVTLGL